MTREQAESMIVESLAGTLGPAKVCATPPFREQIAQIVLDLLEREGVVRYAPPTAVLGWTRHWRHIYNKEDQQNG